MANNAAFDFEKMIPGFEFLKNFNQNAGGVGLSSGTSWVTPSLDPKELEKKIQELKAVQFWLDQNVKGIGATIQALEVQKMTISTLQGMNFNMQDLTETMRANSKAWSQNATATGKEEAGGQTDKSKYNFSSKRTTNDTFKKSTKSPQSGVDPNTWWSSLGKQFQQIAEKTVLDMQRHAEQHQHLHKPVASKATSKRAPRKTRTFAAPSGAGRKKV